MSDYQIYDPGLLIAENINILDFSMMLVCTVEFKHNQGYKQKLEEMTLQTVFNAELEENQALRLSLITSSMICKSLYGALEEKDDGGTRQYIATFIAKTSDHCERIGDSNSERFIGNQQYPFGNSDTRAEPFF